MSPASLTPKPTPNRRRWSFWLGLGCIAAGLSLLGYFGWAFYGTNFVAKQRQEQIVKELTADWQRNDGPVDAAERGLVPKGEASALIRIPRFGEDYVIPVLEGTSDAVLSRGYGRFESSAPPGAIGNYTLAAHRVTHGEPLRRMPDLRPGDKVIVETRKATYTYQLDTNPNDLVIPFTGVWVLDQRPKNPDGGVEPSPDHLKLITLTTCSEIFHTDNRMIAFGHLVDTKLKADAVS